MDMFEFYKTLNNPLDDLTVIKKIIFAYAKSNAGYSALYNQLVYNHKFEQKSGKYSIGASDAFYAGLFNAWKRNVVNMSQDEINYQMQQGWIAKDFIKMRDFLKTVKDIKTWEESRAILRGTYDDKELENALEKYNWEDAANMRSWTYVCSRYITSRQTNRFPIKHRLYLNIDSIKLHAFAIYFIEKCEALKLSYEFKFDEGGMRDDTLVVYCSDDNLFKYLRIIREIREEHPDLVPYCKKPPLLTSSIDGWIGYGAEPNVGKRCSYNSLREKLIEDTMGTYYKKWFNGRKSGLVNYNGKKYRFVDYLVLKSYENFMDKLHQQVRNNRTYGEFDLNHIQSTNFKNGVWRGIKKYVYDNVDLFLNDKTPQAIHFPGINGKEIYFSPSNVTGVSYMLFAQEIATNNTLIKCVQSGLKADSKKHGIDSNNFCFDATLADDIKKNHNNKKGFAKVIGGRPADSKVIRANFLNAMSKYAEALENGISPSPQLRNECQMLTNLFEWKEYNINIYSASSQDYNERVAYYFYQMYRSLAKYKDVRTFKEYRDMYLNDVEIKALL